MPKHTVHFTERETEYADRGTGLVIDRSNAIYIAGHNIVRGNLISTKPVSKLDDVGYKLARQVIKNVKCRFCMSPIGAPCLVWNNRKDKNRAFPHSIRYSDYHQLKREYLASTWKGACTSRDCPSGPDCTDSCMMRAGFKHIEENYAHPQQVLNSFYDIEERFGTLEPGHYAAHPVGIYEGDGRIVVHGSVTGRINFSEPERQELPVVSRKEILTRAAEKALEDLQQYAIFGDDVYEDETVLMVRYRHTPDAEKTYSYVAVKLDGRWYCTGYQNEGPRGWDRLVETFLSHGEVVDIWINTGWEQIIE